MKRVCEALGVSADDVKGARRAFGERQAKEKEDKERDDFFKWAHGEREDEPLPLYEELPSMKSVGEESGKGVYERVDTKLVEMEKAKRVQIINCCLLLLLSLEEYSSLSRILLLRLSSNLAIPRSTLVNLENQVAAGLLQAASHLKASEHAQKEAQANATSRKWKVGLATVAGAALIGVTGGLAAPFLAAGLGSIFGAVGLGAVSGLLGGLAGNIVLITGLFGAYGAKMTGEMVEEMAKDIEDFKFLPLNEQQGHMKEEYASRDAMQSEHKLRVAIGISGYLTTRKDVLHPATVIASSANETFALQWEVEALLRLGLSFTSVLKSYVWEVAKYEILRRTLLGVLSAGLWPLGLMRMARVIDNPFNIARIRADKAGKVLARALIAKCAGNRPVSLVGVSLGGRVVFACLQELAAQNAFGIVENAVIIGAPVTAEGTFWMKARAVVAGRLINVYSEKDLLLGFVFRASTAQFDISGLQKTDEVSGVENVNVTDTVDGHTKYRFLTGRILMHIGFEDISIEGVDREAKALKAFEESEKKEVKKEKDTEKEAKAVETFVQVRVAEKVPHAAARPPPKYSHADPIKTTVQKKQTTVPEKPEIAESSRASSHVIPNIPSPTYEELETLHIADKPPVVVDEDEDEADIIESAELTYLDPEPFSDSD